MSLDLDPYRRIAADHGEAHLYDDATLLRLYAVLQDLVPRLATQTCPHLFDEDSVSEHPKPTELTLDFNTKEAPP